MAKITANGNREVGRVAATSGEYRSLFVLRSDGKVLRRLTGDVATGYAIYGSLKRLDGAEFSRSDVERLSKILARRGFTIQEVK